MKLRIHGDNIVECERALKLIAEAYNGIVERNESSIYCPIFFIQAQSNQTQIFEVELFGGHNRWGLNIGAVLANHGSPIREGVDAYITKVNDENEELLFAIEFCNALPAGNNAWQRNGRALTCATLGIPYLYFAEIGGVELKADRSVKAPRFPNPIVPFSYLTTSVTLNTICLPIYEPHPAITPRLREKFILTFGLAESLILIKNIIDEKSLYKSYNKLLMKGLNLVKVLTASKARKTTLDKDDWKSLLSIKTGIKKASWLNKHEIKQLWSKKQSEKLNTTNTFKILLAKIQQLNALSIGAKDIPICLIPVKKVKALIAIFKSVYKLNSNSIIQYLQKLNSPILIVWITGFKPRGDDSRPDRGLIPLARMLFGNGIEVLTIVYGPAKPAMWDIFHRDPLDLAKTNGLWEAVINLSDFIFIDSSTSSTNPMAYASPNHFSPSKPIIHFPKAKQIPNTFSEHDVDTAIHLVFSKQDPQEIYECMCNPPGGDWSGISILNPHTHHEYRWTSLPRVSHSKGKRPDHVIQFNIQKTHLFLAIESKNLGRDLDKNIGIRLKTYLKDLLSNPPIAHKKPTSKWELYEGEKNPLSNFVILSVGAFCFKNEEELTNEMTRGNLDIIFAFDFQDSQRLSLLHIKSSKKCRFLLPYFIRFSKQFQGRLEVQIH